MSPIPMIAPLELKVKWRISAYLAFSRTSNTCSTLLMGMGLLRPAPSSMVCSAISRRSSLGISSSRSRWGILVANPDVHVGRFESAPRHTRGPDFHRRDQRPHHESPGLAGADGPGDTIVVAFLDRFSRNFEEGVRIQAELTARDIGIVALRENIDGSAAAKFLRRSFRPWLRPACLSGFSSCRWAGVIRPGSSRPPPPPPLDISMHAPG